VLEEMWRVAGKTVVVAAPVGPGAHACDRALAEFYRVRERPLPPWLREHLDNGFPEDALIEDFARNRGRLFIFSNERLDFHSWMMRAESNPLILFGSLVATLLFLPLVRHLTPWATSSGPCYRRFYILSKDEQWQNALVRSMPRLRHLRPDAAADRSSAPPLPPEPESEVAAHRSPRAARGL
jgi:hypothetical protein